MDNLENCNKEDFIVEDWLEFKTSKYATRERTTFININRSEISEVIAPYDVIRYGDDQWCTIVMKNGNSYDVNESYKKVVEML